MAERGQATVELVAALPALLLEVLVRLRPPSPFGAVAKRLTITSSATAMPAP